MFSSLQWYQMVLNQIVNCSWLEIRFPFISLILKNFHWPFPGLWSATLSNSTLSYSGFNNQAEENRLYSHPPLPYTSCWIFRQDPHLLQTVWYDQPLQIKINEFVIGNKNDCFVKHQHECRSTKNHNRC